MCHVPHSYMRHTTLICETYHIYIYIYIYIYGTSYSYVRHNSCTRVTCPIHMRDTPHWFVRHTTFIVSSLISMRRVSRASFIWKTHDIYLWDTPHLYVSSLISMRHASHALFKWEIYYIYMCDKPNSCAWHDIKCVTLLIHMTWCAWHASFLRKTCHIYICVMNVCMCNTPHSNERHTTFI